MRSRVEKRDFLGWAPSYLYVLRTPNLCSRLSQQLLCPLLHFCNIKCLIQFRLSIEVNYLFSMILSLLWGNCDKMPRLDRINFTPGRFWNNTNSMGHSKYILTLIVIIYHFHPDDTVEANLNNNITKFITYQWMVSI